MALSLLNRIRIHPHSKEEQELVRQELVRILETSHFTTSKRYPAFLRYVVEETLQGQSESLKERTVGIEVFHRQPDYDTNSDTVVRFTAGEVRKRLALCYHEVKKEPPLLIVLAPGSYTPEFYLTAYATRDHETNELPVQPPPNPECATTQIPVEVKTLSPQSVGPFRPAPLFRMALFMTLVGVVLAAVFWTRRGSHDQSLADFWQPVRNSPGSVILCTGGVVFSSSHQNGMAQAEKTDEYPYISVQSAAAVAHIADLLGRGHTEYAVQAANATTLTDLREHSVVFIGAYNNEWTPRIMNKLRYRFGVPPEMAIYDSSNPARVWKRASNDSKDSQDYALVARFRDPETEHIVVLVAGIRKNGTEAAAQFVTSNRFLKLVDSTAEGWSSKNIELVLKTNVINGKTGSPTLEAFYTW